jgi:glycosyltransferase involved in cell wall biosynthesis
MVETPVIIQDDDFKDMFTCDILVGTIYNDIKKLYWKRIGKIAHLCQGYEPLDYMARLNRVFATERYQRSGLLSFVGSYFDTLKFKRRIREIEAVYSLPTFKAAVSSNLAELVTKRYNQECAVIQNGVDLSTFYPDRRKEWGQDGIIKILSVGSIHVGFKGITDTLTAIKILRSRGMTVELHRVAPGPQSRTEQISGVVDHYYSGLNEEEMANLYRKMDIYISSAIGGDGFGLPAREALASGTPCILTSLPAYNVNIGTNPNFACFVPPRQPEKIAEGVEKFADDIVFRERCIEEGFHVVNMFSLERTKEDLVRFIEGVSKS